MAQRTGSTLKYIFQDHLGGTSLTTSSSGTSPSTIKYFSFGSTRSGSVSTDIKFTGQRLDGTGLYYYGARYYDPEIGRFISPDTIVPNFMNPQALNRYSYCLNNPLRYIDPSGHEVDINGYDVAYIYSDIAAFLATGQMLSQGTVNAILSAEFGYYDYYRSVETADAHTLELSEIKFNVKTGILAKGRVAQYNSETHEIIFNVNERFSFNSRVLAFAHEARHALQGIFLSRSPEGSWDQKKWNDTTYCEWDAHKYAGDLDDRLGWWVYCLPFDMTCYMQKLDLEVSYAQYYKAYNRLFDFLLGSGELSPYKRVFIEKGWFLTPDDYINR